MPKTAKSRLYLNLNAMKTTRNLWMYVALISASMVFNACTQAKESAPEVDLKAAAEELDSLFLAAFNSGDAEAMMKLYWNSPELKAYFPVEQQLTGYEAVKASYVRDFESMKGAKLEYTDAHNMVFKDVVIGYGTFKVTMPVEGGEPMQMEGRFTEVKAMNDGKMVIILDHASVPMPAPEEAAPAEEKK